MATKGSADITFVIPGQAQPPATRGAAKGTVKASVLVGATRGGG